MKTTVSKKGQITIPKPLRVRLGIRPHQVLEVREERDRLVLVKCETGDALDQVFGVLKLRHSTDGLVAALRDRKHKA
ncbi:MAG: AbrB/MazE/SpoVT family DNA-binding domain-containing protein [Acidobacteriia bacterium]|nr:AbrB/MazE/SpoVT family DNA-binding domain-containing protein [Terriglobia bacterium]